MNLDSPLHLIEFFGIPGAGKTTLARSLADELRLRTRADLSADWKAQSASKKLGYILSAFGNLRCMAAAGKLAVRLPLTNKEGLLRLGRLVAKSSWLRSQKGTLLLDQGFVQDLWSILFSARRWNPDPRLLFAMVSCLYRGTRTQILFIDIDPTSASDRIGLRTAGDSRLDGLPEGEIRKYLIESAGIPDALTRAASAAGLAVKRVDGSLPPEILVQQLKPTFSAGMAVSHRG